MNNYFRKLREIRKRYKDCKNIKRLHPYDVYDWDKVFTPIERNVWADIRFLGLPFYPQYPVGKYFIDFADPIKKIGVEVDGKIHQEKMIEDGIRTKELEKLGWRIIRIMGRDTFKNYEDFFTEDYEEELSSMEEEYSQAERRKTMKEYYETCSEGILLKLKEEIYQYG